MGCFGLGAAYYLQKQGLRVLGFDKAHGPGTLGTGSVGYGRIWRHLHCEDRYCAMQKEAEEIWREVEKATGQEILHPGGLLYMKKIGHPDLEVLNKYGVRLSAAEIMKRWPAMVVPDYLEGIWTTDAGVIRIQVALNQFRQSAVKLGADLRYRSHVSNIDHENGTVTLESGETFKAKTLVVTCGATTD